MAQTVQNLPAMQETWVQSLSWEDPLEKEMATHSIIPAWEFPWTEESGRLSPWGCKESDTTEQLNTFIIILKYTSRSGWGTHVKKKNNKVSKSMAFTIFTVFFNQ